MADARRIPAGSSDAVALVRGMIDDLAPIYGRFDRASPSATPEEMSPPGGGFVALYEGDRAVAGGGVKRLEDGTGEIKRMFVVAERRGCGLARELLAALEDLARDLGYERVRLDTGPKQPHARSLYVSAGYLEIPAYNENPYASFWGEKIL